MPLEPHDPLVIEDLYDAHGALCYQLAYRMVTEERLACAIVRDVFLAVWSGESVFDPTRGSVQTWLVGQTHRRAVLAVRRQRQLRTRTVDAVGAPPGLDTVERYVLELAYFGGHTQPEIASLTGAALGTIKTLTLEALRELVSTRPSTLGSR